MEFICPETIATTPYGVLRTTPSIRLTGTDYYTIILHTSHVGTNCLLS